MQGDAGKSRVEPELSGGGQSAASIGQADTKADRLFLSLIHISEPTRRS